MSSKFLLIKNPRRDKGQDVLSGPGKGHSTDQDNQRWRLSEIDHGKKKNQIPLSVERTSTGSSQEGSKPNGTRKADIYKEQSMIRIKSISLPILLILIESYRVC